MLEPYARASLRNGLDLSGDEIISSVSLFISHWEGRDAPSTMVTPCWGKRES